jgi:hypothetical protein
MNFGAIACGVAVAILLLGAGGAVYRSVSHTGASNLIVGSVAHVAVRIPENGVGLIALVIGSRRTTLPARCSEGGTIARSTEVVVVDVRGSVAVVCPLT